MDKRTKSIFIILLMLGIAFVTSLNRSEEKGYYNNPDNRVVIEESFPEIETADEPATIQTEASEDYTDTYSASEVSPENDVIEVPYVGMPESKIAETSLGPPTDVGGNTEVKFNIKKKVTIYYFFKNGVWIYCARCIDGRVVTVSDYRDDESTGYVPPRTTYTDDDRYDVSRYRNAEDFYDDNYYNFHDYYDAEKYYNEHR